MSKTDLEYLKEYTRREEEKAKLKVKPEEIVNDANTEIEKATEDTPDLAAQIKQRKLHRQAAKMDAEDEEIDSRKEQSEKEAKEKDRLDRSTKITDVTNRTLTSVGNNASQLQDRVASMKTTGGIALLLVLLAVILITIVQVNAQGDTRLKQIWYMLNGRSTLQGKVEINPGGAGASFGNSDGNGAGATFSAVSPTDNLSYFNTSLGYRGSNV